MNPRHSGDQLVILLADDDEDDRELVRDAFDDADLPGQLTFATDGQDLLDCLRGERPQATERPQIILLDLNMPRKDGREALAEIKADDALRDIPVVVLSTSRDQDDVKTAYRLGASSFIAKPTSHAGLVDAMRNLSDYWFNLVELPTP